MSVHREQWDEERCSGRLCIEDCENCPYREEKDDEQGH